MHNIGSYLIWALAACILCNGSLTEDSQSAFVCLMDEPDINQEESSCRTEIQDSNKFQRQLQEVKAKLQGVEAVLTMLEKSHRALQTRLDNQHQAVLRKIENLLQPLSNKTDADKEEIVPYGFERIGTRYFLKVNEGVDWYTANRRCRKMRGFLASFQNEDELKAVTEKLIPWGVYWLGINDQKTEGHYVSVASGKPAEVLKWHTGQPNDAGHGQNCVGVSNNIMWDYSCARLCYFICQADNAI